LKAGDATFPIAMPSPALGEHNEEVLSGILGLNGSDLARLDVHFAH
jgi:hypothetical protein